MALSAPALKKLRLAVAAGTVVFFNYGDMVAVLPGEFTAKNALYAVVLLAASAVTYAIAGREIVTRFLVASILIACVIPIAKIVVVHASRGDTVYHPVARTTRVEARPNVYLIAIDGYARADVLRKHVGLDIGPFIEQLEQRNVLVAPRSLANYSATFFSIASTLQFDYVVDANSAPVRFRQPYIQIMRGQSRTAKVFRELGYAYVHAASGWESSECGGQEDICLTGVRRLRNRVQSELHLSLIEMTPLRLVATPVLQKARMFATVDELIETLQGTKLPEPFILFAHTLGSHPPFKWRRDCTERKSLEGLTAWISRAAYAEAVECVNRTILALLDFLQKTDPSAMVVLFSDHGSAFDVDLKSRNGTWTADTIYQRYASFIAAKVPAHCASWFSDDLSNVNIIPFVLGCLDRTKPSYLEDRFFLSTYSKEGNIVELTKEQMREMTFAAE